MASHAPSSRQLIYVLHGLLGTATAHFGPQIRTWGVERRIVPIDLPGHGRCLLDAQSPYRQQAFDYVHSIIARLGPGHVVAASYLGSPLAIALAHRKPHLISSLILTGFAPQLDAAALQEQLAGFEVLSAQNPQLAAEFDRLHGLRWRETLKAFAMEIQQDPDGGSLTELAMLAELLPATLICNGSHKTLEREAAENARNFGGRIQGRVIQGAGHIASIADPKTFATAAMDFWRSTPGLRA